MSKIGIQGLNVTDTVINFEKLAIDIDTTLDELPGTQDNLKALCSRLQILLIDSELDNVPKLQALTRLKHLAEAANQPEATKQAVLANVVSYLAALAKIMKSGEEVQKIIVQITFLMEEPSG